MLRHKVQGVYLICALACKVLSFHFGNSDYLLLEALPSIGIWITKTLLAIIAVCMFECFNKKSAHRKEVKK